MKTLPDGTPLANAFTHPSGAAKEVRARLEDLSVANLSKRCADLERAVAILIGAHIEKDGGRVTYGDRLVKGDAIRFVFSNLPDGRIDVSFEPRK